MPLIRTGWINNTHREFDTEGKTRSRVIHSVGPGLMPATWPKLAYGNVGAKNPSRKPPKYPAGFSEKYLAREIK